MENLPDTRALLFMGRAMVDLYCASFRQAPKREGRIARPRTLRADLAPKRLDLTQIVARERDAPASNSPLLCVC
ncbi:hypothetical protein GGD83_004458 [Rhodoblastus sphagnicola]|uniref:hypothetical protein n=1 Tax=Rhodoblastus sphagnicola TaxID=333368 RepID=UPI0014749837|nr:hypothetical protein [Rhodoblastus sphagnicola]MBB4200629.1 hypothetical protein [Rhodoblastus sphagnicola]